MSTPFPHTCTIKRPASADPRPIDAESGQPIGDAPDDQVIYEGRCFLDESAGAVQREQGEGIRRERDGDAVIRGDGVLRLPGEAAFFDQDQDVVTVVANGVTRRARIARASYVRRRIHLLLMYETRAVAG